MAELPIPNFFPSDPLQVKEDMIAFYESQTGRTLQPAEVEVLLFGAYAYREGVHKNEKNNAALSNLAAFATFPILDYLAQNVGIKERIPAQKAKTIIRFTLSAHPTIVIQAGTRVSHADGQPAFEVIEDTIVLAGTNIIDIDCECDLEGVFGNGFAINTITELIDSFTYFTSCQNISVTAGGSEQETDEQLRERIYLAPNAFSTCGPLDAYKFFALSAHPSILDVSVEGPELGKAYPPAGTVAIYPLTDTVPTPQTVLDAVFNACNPEKNRPDTDTVEVIAPTAVNYDITVNLTLYNGADDELIVAQINDLLNTYQNNKGRKLGQDIVREQIIALCVLEGVYKPTLVLPATDLTVSSSQFGNVGTITVTVTAYTNG